MPLSSRVRTTPGWRAGTALIAGVALFPMDAWACPVCIGWTERQGLNGGFYWGALLLTALPFAIVAVIGAWVGYAAWRARPTAAPGMAGPLGIEEADRHAAMRGARAPSNGVPRRDGRPLFHRWKQMNLGS